MYDRLFCSSLTKLQIHTVSGKSVLALTHQERVFLLCVLLQLHLPVFCFATHVTCPTTFCDMLHFTA